MATVLVCDVCKKQPARGFEIRDRESGETYALDACPDHEPRGMRPVPQPGRRRKQFTKTPVPKQP